MTATLIRSALDRRAARRAYWAADAAIGTARDALADTADPADRARLLGYCADWQQRMADTHTAAYGPTPLPWEHGRDLADSMRSAAELYRILAAVEGGRPTADGSAIVSVCRPVLDRMAAAPSLAGRAELLELLYAAAEPVAGGQAAEILAGLPSPGYLGWERVADQAEWWVELPATAAGLWCAARTAAGARLRWRWQGAAGLIRWIDAAGSRRLTRVRAGAAHAVCARAAGRR